eukprot:Lithocolla_globosa_v1_NODE_5318_length_1261_cov_162.312604.p2 type:complete len:125 gc:universal NODE_5318_length_1261_cov_162.312604:598-972(+)
MVLPLPPHLSHWTSCLTKNPPICCLTTLEPFPPQAEQVLTSSSEAAPEPRQESQITRLLTSTSEVEPKYKSSSVTLNSMLMSGPFCCPLRPWPPKPPEKCEKMSKGLEKPPPCRCFRPSSPYWS